MKNVKAILKNISIVTVSLVLALSLSTMKVDAAYGKTIEYKNTIVQSGEVDPDGAIFNENSVSIKEMPKKDPYKPVLMLVINTSGWTPTYRIMYEFDNGTVGYVPVNGNYEIIIPKEVKKIDTVQVVSEQENNKVSNSKITTSYSWKIKQGSIKVRYLEEKSNKVLVKEQIIKGDVGSKYNLSKKSISKYTYHTVNGELTGVFIDNDYKKTPVITNYYFKTEGSVIAYYIDTNKKNLANYEVQGDAIGAKYKTFAKKIKGYTLKEVKGKASGTYKDDKLIKVYYVYQKNSELTNKIKSKEKITEAGDNSFMIASISFLIAISSSAGLIAYQNRKN
ncbi:MAG: MucBP domain-containing protein [Erysipelotrichales bacterium]